MSKKVVAVTSCITGVAHTYMCATALENAAAELGYEIHVEKQGAAGVEDALTAEQIAEADAVVFATDKAVDNEGRFAGKDVVKIACDEGIKNARGAIEHAMAKNGTVRIGGEEPAATAPSAPGKAASGASAVFRHVMSGVSHMLPIVVAGGILTALRYAFGSVVGDAGITWAFETEGSLAFYISQIGATYGLGMMIPVLAAFNGLKPILILPLLSTAIVGLVMYYIVGAPVAMLTAAITDFLSGLSGAGNIALGIVCGLLYFDMGGAVSKVLYAFAIGMLDAGVYGPMAAVMLCGMVPPIGVSIATFAKKSLWSQEERDSGKAAVLLGCSYITEGAIPFATSYPLQVIPSCMIGGAVAAVMSLMMGIECTAPHGGLFLLLIPNVINNIGGFLVCLLVGSLVCAALIVALMSAKRRKDA